MVLGGIRACYRPEVAFVFRFLGLFNRSISNLPWMLLLVDIKTPDITMLKQTCQRGVSRGGVMVLSCRGREECQRWEARGPNDGVGMGGWSLSGRRGVKKG